MLPGAHLLCIPISGLASPPRSCAGLGPLALTTGHPHPAASLGHASGTSPHGDPEDFDGRIGHQ